MHDYWITPDRARYIIKKYPGAKAALEELFPELEKQIKKTAVATTVSFQGKDIGGTSKEMLLRDTFFLCNDGRFPRVFTKVTFEWEGE